VLQVVGSWAAEGWLSLMVDMVGSVGVSESWFPLSFLSLTTKAMIWFEVFHYLLVLEAQYLSRVNEG